MSRVLNAPDAVSPKTREKVEAAIRTLRFVPSAAARAINSGRTRFVGALVPTLDNAIFARFLAALEHKLAERRLSLVVATTHNDPAIEAEKAKTLVDIGAEGLIVSGITHDPALDDLIERCQLPAIATSYHDPDYHLPTVGYDNAAATALALDYLAGQGHRDIAVVHGPLANNDRTRARLAGLDQVDRAVALQFFETEIAIPGGCRAASAVLAAHRRVSAILCFSDVLALGVLFEMQRNAVRVPDDLSLMGIDDLAASAHSEPGLTTVHLPVSRMGEASATAIAGWIETKERPAPVLLAPDRIIRGSTGAVASG
ncbi:substrate-binding domain-containing protein [Ruegeria sp. 2012CJ41-6]|uniref:Substrate-binding domain-containing protein n=1 Tax=Ruegeria spongiae TaxID=2942209 RepID=A0ABT0Q3Y5_9RHOB|nr:substrate-binding domain-containing protein [Ruegeria spongiae]